MAEFEFRYDRSDGDAAGKNGTPGPTPGTGTPGLWTGKVPNDRRSAYIRSLEGTIAYVATANSAMAKRLLKDLEDTIAVVSERSLERDRPR